MVSILLTLVTMRLNQLFSIQSLRLVSLLILNFTSIGYGESLNVSVPSFSMGSDQYEREIIYPGPPRCEALFESSNAHQSKVAMVVRKANERFKIRGWSEGFLKERFKVAEKYDSQSEYYYIRPKNRKKPIATIGITIAEYTEAETKEMIPVEETLKVFPLPRPLDSKKRGFIAELRTYSIERAFHSEAYPKLLSLFFENFFTRLQEYPELYDEPILYTYADETSLRLYGMMGFTKLSENSTSHEGSNWWVMVTTPRILESSIKRVPAVDTIHGFNQPINIKLQNGLDAKLEAHGMALNQEFMRSQNAPMSQHISVINEPLEIEPGVWADKGSSLTWHANGKLAHISKLAKPLPITKDLIANAGGSIGFSPEGKLTLIGDLAKAATVAPGIRAAEHASVNWYPDGSIYSVSRLAKKSLVAENIYASAGAQVEWRLSGGHISYISRLAENADLGDKIIGAKGAEVSWTPNWNKKGKIVVNMVSQIGLECRVAPRIWAAPGSSYYSSHDPKKSPAVSILARPFKAKNEDFKAGDFLSYGTEIK